MFTKEFKDLLREFSKTKKLTIASLVEEAMEEEEKEVVILKEVNI